MYNINVLKVKLTNLFSLSLSSAQNFLKEASIFSGFELSSLLKVSRNLSSTLMQTKEKNMYIVHVAKIVQADEGFLNILF